MMNPLIIVNAQIRDAIPVSMLALDRGLAYGDGVFETMAYQNGDITLWRLHYERLLAGLAGLGIELDDALLTQQMDRLFQQLSHTPSMTGVIKLIITRGVGGRGYQPPVSSSPLLVSLFFPDQGPAADIAVRGARIHRCTQTLAHFPITGIKSLNQLSYVLASDERLNTTWDEGLLCDAQGRIIEATARNLFMVDHNNQLIMPDLSRCGVEGVMKRLITDHIAPALGLVLHTSDIYVEQLLSAKECFLSNSISGIWPVVQCDDNTWAIGSVSRRIMLAVDQWLNTHADLSYQTVYNSCSGNLT